MKDKKLVKEVLYISLPAVSEMILYMFISVFDTMLIGLYGGQTAVSAVGLSNEIMFSLSSVFIDLGVAISITSIVARKYGAGYKAEADQYASMGLSIAIIVSFALCYLLFCFCPTILSIAGAKKAVLSLGTNYMRLALLGLFFKMLSTTMDSIIRGYGNTRTPLLVSTIICIINLSLDYLLIFGNLGFPELGVMGSAVSMLVAQICGFTFVVFYTLNLSKIKIHINFMLKFQLSKLKELISLAVPTSLEEAVFSLSRLLSLSMILHTGTTAFASNQIATTIESISFMQGMGFAAAATTLVGIKIGERNYIRAQQYGNACAFLGGIAMTICGIIFFLFPGNLIQLFLHEKEASVIYYGTLCLMVGSVEQPFIAASLIYAGALKGYGDTKTPFVISLITCWLIRIPLMYYFIYLGRASVVYAWCITIIQWCADGLLMFIFFERKFKKNKFRNNYSKRRLNL
ncbi:MATE family efflux transporter [Clostridium omnivorum]|uniref:Probable multidrug resistance protein NorM n=1 Tax=Clostridium omnivorum TaxID=1604902 RepID=A0ABQ5N7X1_9CLOT|nr:MATE family efflux transporter [Clostridium sp. E14]GLC31332.1 MATE family efflux transporter [Clostridium sp. E14]